MRIPVPVRLAALVFLIVAPVSRGEVIDGYTPAINDRFINGTYPNGTPPTPNASFLLASADLSGVGWVPTSPGNGTKNVTMISDIHYIAATHFPLGVGATVAFRAQDGSYVTRTVQSETQVAGSDVLVGQLTSPVPQGLGGVASYPIATGTLAQFNGQGSFMYSQSARVGQNILAQFQPPNTVTVIDVGTGPTNVITSDYDPNIQLDGLPGLPYEFCVTPGDSGSPTLMRINGQIALVGHHMAEFTPSPTDFTPLGSADSFLSSYDTAIAAQLALSGRTLQVVPVPEPLFILAVAMPATVVWMRRRRRAASGS